LERVLENQKRKISFNRLNKRLFILFIGLLFTFFISQITITSFLGTKSSEIERIRREKDSLRLENEILTSKIDEAKSLEKASDTISKYQLQEKVVNLLEAGDMNRVAVSQ
jgi:hypothetical protein